jgi:hypothetical protein
MTALSDVRFAALRALGYTGATSDMLLAWLQDNASGVAPPPPPSGYTQNGVNSNINSFLFGFDPTAWLTVAAYTGSLWLDANDFDGQIFVFSNGSTTSMQAFFSSATNIRCQIGLGGILNFPVPDQSTGTHHYLISQQVVGAAHTASVAVDGVPISEQSTIANSLNPVLLTQLALMTFSNAVPPAESGIYVADWWLDQGYTDFTDQANIDRFQDNGVPISLGAFGQLPFGAAPLVYVGEDFVAADWNLGSNLGTGGPIDDGVAGSNVYTDV